MLDLDPKCYTWLSLIHNPFCGLLPLHIEQNHMLLTVPLCLHDALVYVGSIHRHVHS